MISYGNDGRISRDSRREILLCSENLKVSPYYGLEIFIVSFVRSWRLSNAFLNIRGFLIVSSLTFCALAYVRMKENHMANFGPSFDCQSSNGNVFCDYLISFHISPLLK